MNVLLVEDNVDIGDAIAAHVIADGNRVDWCMNLRDAFRKLLSKKYDLILLDLRLPDGNGLTLLEDIRSGNDDVPVIIMTAQDQQSDRLEGVVRGTNDFLVKPFDLAELSNRMRLIRNCAR